MFKKSKIVLLIALVLSCVMLVACGGNDDSSTGSGGDAPYDGPCAIKLTAIGQTTINAGKTVQLRASVTGTTNKDVTFTSSDDTVATVSDKGLVTGIKKGEAVITCSLNEDPRCKKTIKVTIEEAVKPTSITIEGNDSAVQWTKETLQLKVIVTPDNASALVTWESSDNKIATVSETGLVTFIANGEVTLTATSNEDSSVKDSVTYTVKTGFFRSDMGSPYWDITNQCADENPQVKLTLKSDQAGYHSCYLANVLATRYYVEGYFKLDEQISAWVWQGFGFGSGLSETSTRYFIFSPRVDGQGNTFNKFIVKDLPNETWGPITTRSQTWGENGLDQINYLTAPVKVALLRDNNVYYYLINDKLMYVDKTTLYDGIPTMPIMVAIDESVTVTDYVCITDAAAIDAKLNSEEYKKTFYASNADIVEYESNEKFVFKSNNVLSKDNKVKSLGDAAMLMGDFEVEFDVSDISVNKGKTDCITGITVNLSRYESADTVETFILGKSIQSPDINGFVGGLYSWAYPKSMEDSTGWYSWIESSAKVADDNAAKHHVKVTRTIVDNVSYFKMYVDGVEVKFEKANNKWTDNTNKYTGAYILWVGGEYASAEVTNFVIRSNIDK